MHHYLAFVWNPGDAPSARKVSGIEDALITPSSNWQLAYRSSHVAVFHNPLHQRTSTIHRLADRQGVILGSLFRRSRGEDPEYPSVTKLDERESSRIRRSGGRHLIANYWGQYLAVLYDQDTASCTLLRDPTANLPCYHAKWTDVHVFFSHLRDFSEYVPQLLTVNWPHVARRLRLGRHLSRDCGLREIEDIPGGESIVFSRLGETRTCIWHPATFCLDDSLNDEAVAGEELRSTVTGVIHTLASQHKDVIVRLSGGLDSSIVTACLARAHRRPATTCLNYYFDSSHCADTAKAAFAGITEENRRRLGRIIGNADERDFARSVAQKCGFRLLEIERRVRDVDFRLLCDAPLTPRPPNYVFFVDQDITEMECIANTNATACFSGDAGDTVFYCTLRAIGALDYAYLHPFGSQLFRHIRLTAELSGESVPRVVKKVLTHGLLRLPLPPAYEPLNRPHLMSDEAAAAFCPGKSYHPWEDTSLRLCPGKRNHVAGVVSALFYPFVRRTEAIAPPVRPLASQPVIETCLRIPSYVLLAGGISRGLARRAFADYLPPEVTRRTVKGLSIGFWQTVVRRNMSYIRERLLDGILVKQGLLDRRKLEEYLNDSYPYLTVGVDQITDCVQCEEWLHRWA